MKRDAYLDDTDAALAEAALRYSRQRYAFDARQRLAPGQRRFDARAWQEIAEMGWLSVATSEDDGGLGFRAGSIALLAQAAGAAGINEPLASTGFIAADVLRLHATATPARASGCPACWRASCGSPARLRPTAAASVAMATACTVDARSSSTPTWRTCCCWKWAMAPAPAGMRCSPMQQDFGAPCTR